LTNYGGLYSPFYSVFPSFVNIGNNDNSEVVLATNNESSGTYISNQPKLNVKRVDASHVSRAKYNWSHEEAKSHRKSEKIKLNSFSSRMRKLKRSFERMMNNPISLKNLRDQNY